MKKLTWIILFSSLLVLLFVCCGRVPGKLRNNVLENYSSDIDLLQEFAFPYPFLKEKIRKEGLVKREDIQKVIRGFEKHEVIEDKNLNHVIDVYIYDMGWYYGKSYIEIAYDSSNVMVSINEFGSSLMIVGSSK
jgi:hypothetical protein